MLRWRGPLRFPTAQRNHKNLKIPHGWMMPKTVFSVFSGLIFGASLLASLSSAQTRVAARPLRLVPEPKRSEEHTSELQSHLNLVCRLLLEKKKKNRNVLTYKLTSIIVSVIVHGLS